MVSSRTLRVNDDLPMLHDDKRTLAWFYSDSRELLFGIERVRVRVFLYFTTFTSHSFHILFLTDQMKGFVSIFQLLGRYVRGISVVFHRNFTRRDNQHVRFSLHKQPVRRPVTRGGCTGCVRTPPQAPKVRLLILNIKVKECSRLDWSLRLNSDI